MKRKKERVVVLYSVVVSFDFEAVMVELAVLCKLSLKVIAYQ